VNFVQILRFNVKGARGLNWRWSRSQPVLIQSSADFRARSSGDVSPIRPPNPRLVHRPVLPSPHDVDALVAEAGSRMRNLPDAQLQCRPIPGRAIAVEPSARESRRPTSRTVAT